jgi:hypothetical protein
VIIKCPDHRDGHLHSDGKPVKSEGTFPIENNKERAKYQHYTCDYGESWTKEIDRNILDRGYVTA